MRKPPLQDIIIKNRDNRPIRDGVRNPRAYTPTQNLHASQHVRNERLGESAVEHNEHQQTVEERDAEFFSRRTLRRPGSPMVKRRGMGGARGGLKWLSIAIGTGLIVVIASVTMSLLFAGATIVVYPKQDTRVVNAIFTVEADGGSQSMFPLEFVTIEKIEKETIVALGEDEVEERAVGKITIYNEFSETPQRIIPRTRFKSSGGMIYRVSEAVEIPGRKPDGTPGTIEVIVRAEEPGEGHNIEGPDTFTLPGYEEAGLPQAEKIYAKTTEGMSGGFKGVRRTVSEEERSRAITSMETKLKDLLLAEAFSESGTPDNFQLYKDSLFFEFETQPDELVGTDKVTISVKGTLHGVLFPKSVLARKVAENTLDSYSGAPIQVKNIKELLVSTTPKDTEGVGGNPWEAVAFQVTVQGKAHFIWEIDEKALASDFTSKNKEILETSQESGIMSSHPGIDRLETSIRPFWKRTFPESTDDIVVVTKLDD